MNNKLKARRVELGYSQEQLAESVGIHPNTYRKYEKGEQSPSIEVAQKIALVLNVKAMKLIEWLL